MPATTSASDSMAAYGRIVMVSNQNYPEMFAGASAYILEHAGIAETTTLRHPGHFPAVEGIAGIVASITVKSYLEWVIARDCPVVHLLSSPLKLPRWPRVTCDYEAIGRLGAQHFLDLGNLNLAFYRYFDSSPYNECRDGFVQELKTQGKSVHEIGPCMPYIEREQFSVTRRHRVDWLKSQFGSLPRPVAIMADDDLYAVDVVFAARELGLRIPEDVAILGVNNNPMLLADVQEKISSVDVDFRQIGRIGCELLHRMLNDASLDSGKVPMLVKVPPRNVVIRSSTATFRCDHPGVTAAALFVRRHFNEAISVRDVAAHANMSLRSLQVKYPPRVGRTVANDILCERIKRAQSILENSDLKLAAVAVESGFGTLENLCRVFQVHHHMTPHAWRLRYGRT